MQTSPSLREPLRLLSAALLGPRKKPICSCCRKRIVGLPYPAGGAHLSFCNSNCLVTYSDNRRSRKSPALRS